MNILELRTHPEDISPDLISYEICIFLGDYFSVTLSVVFGETTLKNKVKCFIYNQLDAINLAQALKEGLNLLSRPLALQIIIRLHFLIFFNYDILTDFSYALDSLLEYFDIFDCFGLQNR